MQTYAVSELNRYVRVLLEGDSTLQDVWVEGEVSNMRRAGSGHWYFSVKDAESQLRCVMFRHNAQRQSIKPDDGDKVRLHGSIGLYEARGEYQLYVDQVQAAGVGDLYQQFEALKAKLQAEGLFDEARKRPIPEFARRIGVVTSSSAAAFQDILNVLRRRFPLAQVILSSTLVQGQDAPPKIVAAIERLNQHADIDVILVCRGGGSIEDLWAFNDEAVARAVAASKIPIISGVGHEIDFTIIDFVADLRAPTPSAAAEVAVPNVDDLSYEIERLTQQLDSLIGEQLAGLRADLKVSQRSLERASPETTIRSLRQQVDDRVGRLDSLQKRHLALLRERLAARTAALNAANPESILARGYAIVTRSDDGSLVQAEKDAQPGDGITITLHEGELTARVEDKDTHGQYSRTLF